MIRGIYYTNITEGNNFEIIYPLRAKVPKQVVTVKDMAHAQSLWKIRTRKYLFETLRGWVLQRKHALNAGENHFKPSLSTKNVIIEKFLLCLMSNYESSLHTLVSKIAGLRWEIEQLAPSMSSKYYNHYEEVILPILEWCEEVLAEFKQINQLLNK